MTAASVRLRSAIPVALACIALGAAAGAQTPDAERQTAREHFERGVDLIQHARWLDAIIELQAARQYRVTAPVMYNLGLAQRAVGRSREAMGSFREFVRLVQDRNPELSTQAETYIRELGASMGHMEFRLQPTTATVQVDGSEIVMGPDPFELDPGRHVVVVQADGFAPDSRTIDVRAGSVTVIDLRMVPRDVASHVTIESGLSTAEIRIDGAPVGFGLADETVRPGRHVVEVRAAGHATFHRDFDAIAAGTLHIHASLVDTRTVFESPWFWVVTGAVVVGAGVAAGFLLSTTAPPFTGSWGLVDQAATAGGGRH